MQPSKNICLYLSTLIRLFPSYHAVLVTGSDWVRVQALVDMMKVNMSIHTIPLVNYYSEHELFRGPAIPYLETNRLRPRVCAIQKTCPCAYRTKVLGRALLAARTDVNSFWMILSGNTDVDFSSTNAMTTPSANLPAPATSRASATATGSRDGSPTSARGCLWCW